MRKFKLNIKGLERELSIVTTHTNNKIAFLDVIGDTELISHSAQEICKIIPLDTEIIIAPETGGIILAHKISELCHIKYLGIRKKIKPNMIEPLEINLQTIGTKEGQKFYFGQNEIMKIKGRKVIIVDEIISTGGTVIALEKLIEKAGGILIGKFCIATEGIERKDVQSLCHLPLL